MPRSGPAPIEPQILGLIDRPFEDPAPRDHIGQIDDGARRSGHGDAVAPNTLAVERGLVDHNAPALPLLLRRDVNRLSVSLQNSPNNGSTEVTQGGTVSAGQHRGHEASVTRERQMANGVHALVHTMKPPPPHPPVDRVLAQPKCDELRAPNHPMLPPRELRNRPIRGVLPALTVHYAVKSRSTPNSPPQCLVRRPWRPRREWPRAPGGEARGRA
jgi:hypothetical protein